MRTIITQIHQTHQTTNNKPTNNYNKHTLIKNINKMLAFNQTKKNKLKQHR